MSVWFQVFLVTLSLLVLVDFVRWLFGSVKHGFIEWMVASVIGNAFWAILMLAVLRFVYWLFDWTL